MKVDRIYIDVQVFLIFGFLGFGPRASRLRRRMPKPKYTGVCAPGCLGRFRFDGPDERRPMRFIIDETHCDPSAPTVATMNT